MKAMGPSSVMHCLWQKRASPEVHSADSLAPITLSAAQRLFQRSRLCLAAIITPPGIEILDSTTMCPDAPRMHMCMAYVLQLIV